MVKEYESHQMMAPSERGGGDDEVYQSRPEMIRLPFLDSTEATDCIWLTIGADCLAFR